MFKEASSYIESSLSTALVLGIVLHHARTLRSLVHHRDIVSSLQGLSPARGGLVAQALARITEEDHKAGRPLSTSVVVGSDGRPGEGFFNQARALGYSFERNDQEEFFFWKQQLKRLGFSSSIDQLVKSLDTSRGVREIRRALHTRAQGHRIQTSISPTELDRSIVQGVQSNFDPGHVRHSHVYIPAGHLQVGDKVLFPKNPKGKRLAANEDDLKEVTVTRIQTSGELVQWESSENRTYRMPVLGVHVKIRARDDRPKSILPGDFG